ncbi:hypothetical protein RF11_04787 [Thelohanellus kitauei]|uniref:Uncharacterized protein n=1 Tax=Thelohanellus kitauei TaxID=669202 RepID=A0A0C2M642_THEKT|nr:hypothetical protein RF11_04787 [Thelohanellus kitauei]
MVGKTSLGSVSELNGILVRNHLDNGCIPVFLESRGVFDLRVLSYVLEKNSAQDPDLVDRTYISHPWTEFEEAVLQCALDSSDHVVSILDSDVISSCCYTQTRIDIPAKPGSLNKQNIRALWRKRKEECPEIEHNYKECLRLEASLESAKFYFIKRNQRKQLLA